MPDGVSAPGAPEQPPDPAAPAPGETIMVEERVVACDGGDEPLGHPRVYLRIVHDAVVCPYCSRLYVLKPGAGHADGH